MDWLEQLRAADDGRKKKWIFTASAVAAVILFLLWGRTLRVSLNSVEDPSDPKNQQFGFWQSAKSTTALLYRNFSDTIGNLNN